MEQQRSQKFIRQRKFLMALPLLALPFLTLLFWALGGGQVSGAESQTKNIVGFNLELPGANLKDDKNMNKMSYYDQAQTDSLKKTELMKNDPYYQRDASDQGSANDSQLLGNNAVQGESVQASPYTLSTYRDANETKVYDRLKQLDMALKQPKENARQERKNIGQVTEKADLDRLDQMMTSMQQGDEPDPEMQQLSGIMERILDVQHPERVQEKLRKASEERKGQVFAVESVRNPDPVSLLGITHGVTASNSNSVRPLNGFYGLENGQASSNVQNAIEAVIHETQTVVTGATIKMRLLNDVFINGTTVPKDNFIYGVANLSGDRLRIQINGIRYQNHLFPVALNIYDTDGLEGVNVPGAVTRDVAKQSADRSMQNIGLSGVDPSWQVQAAGAGVEAAKSLFSKKVKLVKVTLKAGYKILLYDEKQKQADK
jgi:conjugative transposon TraM protein